MKIIAVHLLAEKLPGIARSHFNPANGDEFHLGMGCVFLTTGPKEARRFFALPLSSVRMELSELPDLDAKPAKK